MSMHSTHIRDVSDTALWVAALRGQESQRPNPLFRDPLATVLAGVTGHTLREKIGSARFMQWMITLRTVAIDQLVQSAVARGVDTIVSLGAGMDTRAYRLAIPPEVRWIEIDFPNVIEHKRAALKDHAPKCQLEFAPLDLTALELRRQTLSEIARDARSIAVITEGVLLYLTPESVDCLARDLFNTERVDYWIQDYYNGRLSRWQQPWGKEFRTAPVQFESPDWCGYFAERGWNVCENIRLIELAKRLGRRPPLSPSVLLTWLFTRSGTRFKTRDRLGFVLFGRNGSGDRANVA